MYIRLAFSKNSYMMIKHLVENIESDHKLFHSQLSEKANLGCHDFHITLVGRLRKKHEKNISKVFTSLRESGEFTVKPMYIQVTRSGCVKLIIQHNHKIIQLVRHIMTHIPDGNGYFTNTHITLGSYFGQDIRLFQERMNKIYSFGNFLIDVNSVELDEDACLQLPKVSLTKI